MVDTQQRHKHESREIYIVESRYQTTIREDIEDFTCASVQWYEEWVDP
jgi:hypothetical protein